MRDIVGTWRLVETSADDGVGGAMPKPYGDHPMGVVVFAANHRLVTVLCDSGPGVGAPGEREYSSYCGEWQFDGTTLRTRVDAASDPSRVGGEQVRQIEFEGDRLVLRPPPRKLDGGMQHRRMVFERVAEHRSSG